MNKKSLVIMSFAFIFLLSVSIVFAVDDFNNDEKISFGKWLKQLWGKITGTTITDLQSLTCADSDNGKNYTAQGTCTDSSHSNQDSCSGSQIIEYFCGKGGSCTSETISCGLGKTCSGGACINSIISPIEPTQISCADIDGDGYNPLSRSCLSPYDCDDRINGADGITGNADDGANMHPGATEICGNNIDEDCVGGDLVCTNLNCISNFTISNKTCLSNDVLEINWTDVNSCALNYTEKSSCDYNKNNLVCESFPGIESVGIGGYLLNISKNYTDTGINLVQLAQTGFGGVDFNWNFADPLNFCNISVEVAEHSNDFGYTIVKNVNAKNKTIWVERLNNSNKVCVKDIPGEISIGDFSSKCNENDEVLVSCPSGINSPYNCIIDYDAPPSKLSWFKVWPLNHSAVKEITFLASTGAVSGACSENWNCTNWTNILDECGTKNCVDLNNCGTNFTRPDEVVSCVSQQEAGECVPDWDCSDYGKCADGIKERVCADLNNCEEDTTKPSETSDCKKISPLIIALIFVGLLLIIFLIWYFTRKKDEEGYSETQFTHQVPPSPPRSPPVQTNVYTPRPQYAPRP